MRDSIQAQESILLQTCGPELLHRMAGEAKLFPAVFPFPAFCLKNSIIVGLVDVEHQETGALVDLTGSLLNICYNHNANYLCISYLQLPISVWNYSDGWTAVSMFCDDA